MLFCDENGKILDEAPKVSLLDHGFLFGDSIYEVVRLYHRKLFGWQEHRERLLNSAKRLGLEIEGELAQCEKRMLILLRQLGASEACVRIMITRGEGPLHINPLPCKKPKIYMAAWDLPEHSPEYLRVMIPRIRRNPSVSLDPAIKSGNYLNNVLAFQEAANHGYDDALLLNPWGEITELTTSNIAWSVSDKVKSPSTSCGILHGVTRKVLGESVELDEGSFSEDALKDADEVFALSTLKELVPITELRFSDGRCCSFLKGPKCLQLREKLRDTIEQRLESEPEVF